MKKPMAMKHATRRLLVGVDPVKWHTATGEPFPHRLTSGHVSLRLASVDIAITYRHEQIEGLSKMIGMRVGIENGLHLLALEAGFQSATVL